MNEEQQQQQIDTSGPAERVAEKINTNDLVIIRSNKIKKKEWKLNNIIYLACLKHLPGQHNQKRHGWRYGGLQQARRSMRSTPEAGERDVYRKRAGMPGLSEIQATKKPYIAPKKVSSPKTKKPKDYHDFSSIEDASNSFNNDPGWKNWVNSLSYGEKQAFENYTDGDYKFVNGSLRKGLSQEQIQYQSVYHGETVKHMDSALARGSLHQDMILYRGFKSTKMGKGKEKVGGIIKDKGYSSTSTDKAMGENWALHHGNEGNSIMLRIKAPKGSQGGFMNLETSPGYNKRLSEHYSESEFVFPRGQKFRIDNITENTIGYGSTQYTVMIYDVTAIKSRSK